MADESRTLHCWNCGQEIIEADAGPPIGLYYFHTKSNISWCENGGGRYATPVEPRFVLLRSDEPAASIAEISRLRKIEAAARRANEMLDRLQWFHPSVVGEDPDELCRDCEAAYLELDKALFIEDTQ